MTRRVTSLSVHRTALIVAVCAAVIAVIFAVLMVPIFMAMPGVMLRQPGMGMFGSGAMLIMMPVLYFVFAYLFTAIWVFIFNLVAPRLGGLPVTFAPEDEPGGVL